VLLDHVYIGHMLCGYACNWTNVYIYIYIYIHTYIKKIPPFNSLNRCTLFTTLWVQKYLLSHDIGIQKLVAEQEAVSQVNINDSLHTMHKAAF